ncbi:MAG: NAD(P)H-dependent flavin oxidoreductase [Persicimonas sp.]
MPTLPASIRSQTRLPAIAAPMFLVSGPELVTAACKAGIVGSFPTPNAREIETLDAWMSRINEELEAAREANPDALIAPWAANMVVHPTYERREAEIELICKHQPEMVITALGNPAPLVEPVHDYGGIVFADVNSLKFARKAAQTGVDGLILVSAGAGGHTGEIAGFAFLEQVREFFDGYIVLAGGISSGRAIRAAQTLGADLAYMGTRFIATEESMAVEGHKQMCVEATLEDVITTDAITGVDANMLVPSLEQNGLDPEKLQSKEEIDFENPHGRSKAWKDIWSAGQGVGMSRQVEPVADIVEQLAAEYADAVRRERGEDPWTDLALNHPGD